MSLFKKKKFSKEYHNLIKRNNKKLVKLAKETRPWDFSWTLDLLVANLEYIKEYYSNKENVWALENYEWDPKAIKKSRLEMVQEILDEYYAWQNCENKYYKVVFHPETYKSHSNGDGTVTIDDLGSHIEYLCGDPETTRKEFNKEYSLHKKNFFNLLNKYIEELWD